MALADFRFLLVKLHSSELPRHDVSSACAQVLPGLLLIASENF